MSHSFYIQDVAKANLQHTIAAMKLENLVVDIEDPTEAWPALARIYQDKVSVRSIETAMDKDTLQVRIMAYSSLADFRLAMALIDQVASEHSAMIEPEDAGPMSVEIWREEYGAQWQKRQAVDYLNAMVAMYRQGPDQGNMQIWGTRECIEVGPRLMEPLLEDPKTFAKHFFARFRRLNYLDNEDTFRASLMGMTDKSGEKQAVFSVLTPGVPTALSSQARMLVLNHRAPKSADDSVDTTIIAFDDFVSIAGDSLIWLGDGLAITPQYSDGQWQPILQAAATHAMEFFDRPELLGDVQKGGENQPPAADELGIPEEPWEYLTSAPIAMFLLVAGADGTVDEKEIAAFQAKIVEGAFNSSNSEIMQRALQRASAGMQGRLNFLTQRDDKDLITLIVGAHKVVQMHLDNAQSQAFADALLGIGEAVASASGASPTGIDGSIGQEEKAVLDEISQLLRADFH